MSIYHRTYAGVYVFEGIDNVGKTTIIQQLKEKITKNLTYNCIDISFPGKEPNTLGSLVYDIHHNQSKYFCNPISEASLQLLHISAHIDQLQNKFNSVNSLQDIILMDRFWWSTYVYGLANGLSEKIIQSIIAPELLYWENIDIKKIFLIERKVRKMGHTEGSDKIMIQKYQMLAESNRLCTIINNDKRVEDAVSKICGKIFGEQL